MLRFDIITIFPEVFNPVVNTSILKRAQQKKKVAIRVHDLRDYTTDKHRTVDDRPFGGGAGMVLAPQPLFDAIKKIKGRSAAPVILMCPTGKQLTQPMVRCLARGKRLIVVCGHYEGVDERVRYHAVDECISIGDYVLTGGEIPAMVLIDCVSRLVPGVVGRAESVMRESFEGNLLDYPHYTRPANFRGMRVPNVLLSGNHSAIEAWRSQAALARTRKFRGDLLKKVRHTTARGTPRHAKHKRS